jgi:hypothetical protein
MFVNQVWAVARLNLYDSSAPFVSNKCQNIFRENSIIFAEHHRLGDLEICRGANDSDFERAFALVAESRYNLICKALLDIGKESILELFSSL